MFYAGTTIDLFVSTKAVAIKSIVSKTIPTNGEKNISGINWLDVQMIF